MRRICSVAQWCCAYGQSVGKRKSESDREREKEISDPGSVIKLCMQTANEAKVKVCFLFPLNCFWWCVVREREQVHVHTFDARVGCVHKTHFGGVL